MKRILCISRHSPYGTATGREAVEAVLAIAAFDIPVAVLFMDDGVFQLVRQQLTTDTSIKNLGRSLTALEVFGVETVYAHTESLQRRGLTKDDLLLDTVQIMDDHEVSQLINQQDQLLSF